MTAVTDGTPPWCHGGYGGREFCGQRRLRLSDLELLPAAPSVLHGVVSSDVQRGETMAIAAVACQTCMATRCLDQLPVHRLLRCHGLSGGDTAQAVTLQHLATMWRHNSLGRARGVTPTHSDPYQMAEGTGSETLSSSTNECQGLEARSPGEREIARPRVKKSNCQTLA